MPPSRMMGNLSYLNASSGPRVPTNPSSFLPLRQPAVSSSLGFTLQSVHSRQVRGRFQMLNNSDWWNGSWGKSRVEKPEGTPTWLLYTAEAADDLLCVVHGC